MRSHLTSLLPPGPPGYAALHSFAAFRRDAIGFLRRMVREYGDIASFSLGGQPLIIVSDPALIKDILVTHTHCFHKGRGLQRAKRLLGEGLLTSEGEFHLQQRRRLQPAFHRQRIASYGQVMTQYAEAASARWADGETRDVAEEMMRLTLAIVGKTLFDADLGSEADDVGGALTEAISLFRFLTLPFAEVLEKLPLPQVRRFQKAKARLDATVFRMIAEHRVSADRGDLLSMLLAARDDEDSQKAMSDEQIRDEAMTIFLAGHETTANALTWTWYLLSQNPEAEAKFHIEMETVLAGRTPALDDLPQLAYTRKVIMESMRLYPPAWIIGRRVLEDYPLGVYTAPKGVVLLLSQSVTHVDARFFPDPFRFDPDRWTPEADAARPKFAYFPFGGGPRVCIGEQFAWMEAILVLATLGQKWKMRLVPGHRVAGQPIITLRPKYGMRMTLHRRASD